MTEEDARAAGREVAVGTFPFLANGRAKAMGEKDGQVKIVADAKTDRVLGVHIVGPRASDLIAELVRGDGDGRERRGHRALGARPSDAAGGREGSGAGRRQAGHPRLKAAGGPRRAGRPRRPASGTTISA